MMRLCFGTFAHVLRLCKRQNVTDYQLVGTMTRTVDPNCQYLNKDNKTSVSRLLSCTSNLSSGRKQSGSRAYEKSGESISNVVAEAQKANKKDVVQKFEDTVVGLLDEDKKEQAINALLDIIEKDTVIENDKKLSFQKYIGKTKKALLSQDEFVLSELLTGLFLYTAAEVTNTVGKECIKEINAEYLNQFNATKRKIKIIEIHKASVNETAITNTQIVDELVKFDDEFDTNVILFDRVLRKLNEAIIKNEQSKFEFQINRFRSSFTNIASYASKINNASGELKTFTDSICRLLTEWNVAENESNANYKNSVDVFNEIKDCVHEYMSFRQDYLLKRKVSRLSLNATQSEIMTAIFKQAILDFRIIDFVNNDPCISLSSDLEIDVEYFVGFIRDEVIRKFAHDQKEKMFLKINEFTQAIEAYNGYLSLNMHLLENDRYDTFIPLHREDDIVFACEFEKTTINFRKQLDDIYREICDGETLFIYSINGSEELPIPFQKYLLNVKQKYSLMKTLLYTDDPKPFYDFYVCNNIERRVPVTGRFGTSYKTTVIANVDFKSLTDCSRFVILSGTGGLGKSMMMRHLLLDAIENYSETGNIPIFIPLKDFDETTGELYEYVFSRMKSFCTDITETQFQEILSNGNCLLLFDGLDEIASANAKKFERELERFTDMHPNNYYVISSRPTQSFVSYSRFTVMHLKPFSTKQALNLIDNLVFRPDEPIIKEKFRLELEKTLYQTHRSFIENPLLLTIMLITFEQYAEVPSKMHIFYREAFAALSIKHDASKGAYKRTLKTGLTADKFADYFAEICSRSYYDEKFEMNEDEFANYYKNLSERRKDNDKTTNVTDYLYDLCSNMCLMFFESGKYHFTHRSFQEYFCALYFSKQKDKHLESIADFFERRHSRMYSDKTFNMLYDMIPEKVEEYMFLPYLTKLYEQCDSRDGYWTFLETIYPCIQYERGETDDFPLTSCESYLFSFIKELNGHGTVLLQDLPHYDSLISAEYAFALDENENEELVNFDAISYEYKKEYGTPDIVGRIYEFEIDSIRSKPTEYAELISYIEDDNFVLKKEYKDMRVYLEKLKNKQKLEGDNLFDMF